MTCPQMLHQIITKLLMNYSVFNLIMYTQELAQNKWVATITLRPQHLTTILIIVKILFLGPLSFSMIMLCKITAAVIVYQMVSLSHILQGPLTMANLDSKCSLYILPHRFLCLCEVNFFVALWVPNTLHKSSP